MNNEILNITTNAKSPIAMRVTILIITALITLASCSPIRSLAALSRSTDHFIPFSGDDRIRIEPEAGRFAALISPHITDAIRKVEEAHNTPFMSQPIIYVCATNESYYRLTGHRAPAVVTNKLYLSPDRFQGQRPLDHYLSHEMSHLHLVQRLGSIGFARIPAWFKEGLAELASGGATASFVPVPEAIRAINEGRSFVPGEGTNVVSSFLFPRYGNYWNIENRMFYRQSMLFVEFMRAHDESAFVRFLIKIEGGAEFRKALNDAYPGGVSMLWSKFLEKTRAIKG